MGPIKVKKIEAKQELEAAFAIRREVFVLEQQVDPSEEYDEFEDVSTHFLAIVGEEPAGTARWRKAKKGYKLERFAVLKEFRGAGVGSALVREVLKDLPSDDTPVYLNAQLDARKLYEKFGFIQEGDMFLEASIQHFKMSLRERF